MLTLVSIYTSLMNKLKDYYQKYADDHAIAADYKKREESDFEAIRKAASVFRTILCKDIGTRVEPRLPSLYE
jgi:hypothetical protein